MILNRNYYNKISLLQTLWSARQMRKLAGEKIFKVFKLHKTEWPDRLYFYSPRLKRMPVFIGTKEQLSLWKESKFCETICPTNALKVTSEAILIDERGCISCSICVEFAPANLLEMSAELIRN